MTLAGLAVRNLGRNKFRVTLTVLGVAIAIVAFLLLRTVIWAWASGAEWAAKDRVVTRHKVTFVMTLPRKYVDDIRQAPHVKAATWANWFGGQDPNHDREFFATLAADGASYFDVYDEARVPPDQLDAWKKDKQGCIVGDVLAKKLGWKVGDRITIRSPIYPSAGDWPLNVDGIYTATARSIDRSTLVFHWDYVNDTVRPQRKDQVGWIVSRVDDPSRAADVGTQIDKMFDDRDTQTLSQDERAFQASFMGMFATVIKAMDVVSAVILVIMTLVLGNTIAMGVRERTGEYGVLRALGFKPWHVAMWVVGESLVTGILGGVVGVALAWLFINGAMSRVVEENLGSLFPYFRLETANIARGLALAAALGIVAAAIPAWRASKLRVVDAVRRVA